MADFGLRWRAPYNGSLTASPGFGWKTITVDPLEGPGDLLIMQPSYSTNPMPQTGFAKGFLKFAANPSAGQTVTLAGVVWTFVVSGAVGNQTNIGASLSATMTQLAADLNASANAGIALAAYVGVATGLRITYRTASPLGNSFTVAASNATPQAPTLLGGDTPAPGGSALANLRAENARTILGSGYTDAQLACGLFNNMTAEEMAFVRTAKGSLLGYPSDVAQGGHSASIYLGSALTTYLTTQAARGYRLFIWGSIVRPTATPANYTDVNFSANAVATSNYLFQSTAPNIVGNFRLAVDRPTGWTGAPNFQGAGNNGDLWTWTNAGPFNGANANAGKAVVIHKIRLVDSALSGKTFAVDTAADATAYTAAMASGGLFGDDSFVTPAIA